MEDERSTAQDLEGAVRTILNAFDPDPSREGLQDTPARYIKFLREFTTPKPFTFTTFKNEGTDQMICVSGIPFYSLCEHHIAPFFGTATVAYLPGDRIVGLSKLARVVDLYANAFQNQERITLGHDPFQLAANHRHCKEFLPENRQKRRPLFGQPRNRDRIARGDIDGFRHAKPVPTESQAPLVDVEDNGPRPSKLHMLEDGQTDRPDADDHADVIAEDTGPVHRMTADAECLDEGKLLG